MANTIVTVDQAIKKGEQIINRKPHPTYSMENRTGPNSYDCSGFMGVIWGIPGAPATPSMVSVYTQHGFDHYKYHGQEGLQRGDILVWNKPGTSGSGANGHTAMYYGNGKYMQSSTGGPQISTRNRYLGWQDILRGSSGVYIVSFT